MDVDKNEVRFLANGCHDLLEFYERIFERRQHKRPSLNIDDADLAFRGFENDRPAPWRSFRIIDWSQQTRLATDEPGQLFLIPDVISGCDNRNSGTQQLDR